MTRGSREERLLIFRRKMRLVFFVRNHPFPKTQSRSLSEIAPETRRKWTLSIPNERNIFPPKNMERWYQFDTHTHFPGKYEPPITISCIMMIANIHRFKRHSFALCTSPGQAPWWRRDCSFIFKSCYTSLACSILISISLQEASRWRTWIN